MKNSSSPEDKTPAPYTPVRLVRRWKFARQRQTRREWSNLCPCERAVLQRLCEMYEIVPGRPLGWTAFFSVEDIRRAIQRAERSNRLVPVSEIKQAMQTLGDNGFLLEGELWETARNSELARVYLNVKRVWGRGPERN